MTTENPYSEEQTLENLALEAHNFHRFASNMKVKLFVHTPLVPESSICKNFFPQNVSYSQSVNVLHLDNLAP